MPFGRRFCCQADGKSSLTLMPLFLMLMLPWALLAQEQKTVTPAGAPQAASQGKANVADDFIIGAGDILNIFVWRETEVTRSVPVRPDGKISLPLINDVQASGYTVPQLKDIITEKLKAFISDPTVTVTVETVNSQKVTIIGEVTGGGVRPLTGPMHVMDVLSTVAFTPFAKQSKITILRNENGKQVKFLFNYKDYIKGKNLAQNILLKNGDTIVVP